MNWAQIIYLIKGLDELAFPQEQLASRNFGILSCSPLCSEGVLSQISLGRGVVRTVVISTSVLNVVYSTRAFDVIFVFHAQTLVRPLHRPDSVLPSPAQIDKLLRFLYGYEVGLTSVLYSGLKFNFFLQFEGIRMSYFATKLVSHNKTAIISAKLSKKLAAD